jgi:hypothetical protein
MFDAKIMLECLFILKYSNKKLFFVSSLDFIYSLHHANIFFDWMTWFRQMYAYKAESNG